MADKKYIVLADMSIAMKAEFNESDIPEGMDEWEYANQLAEEGAFTECENGGDFRICDVVLDTN